MAEHLTSSLAASPKWHLRTSKLFIRFCARPKRLMGALKNQSIIHSWKYSEQ